MFSQLVRASFAKCYEFNRLVHSRRRSHHSFFLIPTLRGICEDVILLGAVRKFPSGDRQLFAKLAMLFELHERMEIQKIFFRENRPQQPIVYPPDNLARREAARTSLRQVWIDQGWALQRYGVHPSTRSLAREQGSGELSVLYDYLFRLTSASVHFTAQGLLRTGWGADQKMTFSPENVEGYYLDSCRFYGCFLFCAYFEKFGRYLRPPRDVKVLLNELRHDLMLHDRWPEMVTFEELNLPPPKTRVLSILANAVQAHDVRSVIPR